MKNQFEKTPREIEKTPREKRIAERKEIIAHRQARIKRLAEERAMVKNRVKKKNK
jgi:hypothetical protein